MSDYDLPICSECGKGHYRWRATKSFRCTVCGHEVVWSDFVEPVFYNPQWDVVVAVPDLTQEIVYEVRRATGIELTPWHTGGGCMALGTTLPDGRELLVTDADANLPGRYDTELYGGIYDPENPEASEEIAYHGVSIEELVEHLRSQIAGEE